METSSTILFNRKGQTMKIKIDLQKILDNATSVTQEFSLSDFTYKENVYSTYQSLYGLKITRTSSNATIIIYVAGSEVIKNGSQILTLSATNDYVIFDCDWVFSTDTSFESLLRLGYISYDINGNTALLLYKQNSENNALNKTLTYVDTISGKFNHSIGVKSLNIDVVDLSMNFNYVYIPSLNRYYFVDSIEIVSANVTRLHLREDVLMSWKSLIRQQSALVVRSEESTNKDILIDDRLPVRDTISYQQFIPTNLSFKNVTFDFLQYDADEINNRNILINTYTENQYSSLDVEYVESPSAVSGLPNISPLRTRQNFCALINIGAYRDVVNACVKDDATASYILSILWLPFNATTVFEHLQATNNIHAGKKVLDGINGGQWVDYGDESNPVHSTWVHDGGVPYLIVADFMFNSSGIAYDFTNAGILKYQPYSKWEIYIPFVGWVEVDISKVYNKHILVYYAMDMETGISTAYLYNYTDKQIIYSSTCQIGIRLNLVTSNELEITRQKQVNDTNMILGAMTGTLSVGAGAYSLNTQGVANGITSIVKSIASNINAKNMMFERANISYGSSNTALYSPNEVKVRRSYHDEIPIDSDIYAHMQGYPSNEYVANFNSASGYVEIGEIHFNPFNEVIYQDEITEIVTLLKEGVIL